MRTKLVVTAAGLAVILAACSGGGAKHSNAVAKSEVQSSNGATAAGQAGGAGASSADVGSAPAAPPQPAAVPSEVPTAAPQIVRTGSVSIEVGKGRLQEAFDAASSVAAVNGGFVSDSSTSTAGVPTGRLVLRVPSDRFDAAVAAVGRLGKVTAQSAKGQDVTGQLVDLGARLQSLQAEEVAFRTLVGQARAVGDILNVQTQLFQVRQQIEQLTAQQKSVQEQVTFASLDVDLSEIVPPAPAPAPRKPVTNPLARAAHLAAENSAAIGKAVILALGWVFPVLVLAAVGGLVWLAVRRRLRPAQRPT